MAGYIGTTPVPQATQHRESFTATGGQTSFATVGYTPQFIDVYLNGVKLAPADFTATNGSDVVLASGATASDILEIVAYTPFEVANQTFTGTTTAANLTVTGAFTSQGIDDNADAVAITIDSSENVGIGTATPVFSSGYGGLHVHSTYPEVHLTGLNSGSNATDGFKIQKNSANAVYLWNYENALMVFGTNNAEAMRIDSSRNLLVGKTSVNATDIGIVANANGRLYTAVDGNSNVFNRTTSDGDILDFRKDGTTVGSIGAKAGDLVIGTTITSLRFNNGLDVIHPFNQTSGSGSDANTDLGASSARFKDLYLSGGVYLGGTGAANKLTDYETGTWTPVGADASSGGNTASSYASNLGFYTKIGRQVTVHCTLSNINTTGMTSSGGFWIQGLPFAQDSTAGRNVTAAVRVDKISVDSTCFGMVALIAAGSSSVQLYQNRDNTTDIQILVSALQSGSADLFFSITYDAT
jgi:hypothetical protein